MPMHLILSCTTGARNFSFDYLASMGAHKRILGILYIISGGLQIIGMIILSAVFSVVFPLILDQAINTNIGDEWVVIWIVPFIRTIAVLIIIFLSIPSIIGGIAVLKSKTWGLTLILILGCFKLFSFPIGTALGIYTIWVYTEEHRQAQLKESS